MTQDRNASHSRPPGPGLLVGVWAVLLALTALTIAVSRVDLGFGNVAAALAVATTKALLVILFFMHLRRESRLLKGMVFLAFFILALAIAMTFLDLAHRT